MSDDINAELETLRSRIVELGSIEELSDAERAEWTESTERFDSLKARADDIAERATRAASAAKATFNVNTRIGTSPHADQRDLSSIPAAEVRSMAVEAIERSRNFTSDAHAESATKLVSRGGSVGADAARLALATSSDEYRDAWSKAMTGSLLNAEDVKQLERANMTAGTGSSGGYYVPLYLDPSFIITGAGSTNPLRQISNVKTINTLTYNGATAAQVTAGVLGEASAFTDNTPTIAQVQIPTYKYGAYIPASFEAFEDIGNLASDVGELFADAKDIAEATAMLVGTGSSQPKGVMVAVGAVTASRVSPATGGTLAVGDIYKVHQSLPARYRVNGTSRAWAANVTTINSIRQFATTNNYHAYLTTLGQGAPSQLLGDNIYESSAIVNTTTGADSLIYGDFSKYLVIDRIGVQTEFIPNIFDTSTGRPTGVRAWLMHWRFGADCADPNAFRVLRG